MTDEQKDIIERIEQCNALAIAMTEKISAEHSDALLYILRLQNELLAEIM